MTVFWRYWLLQVPGWGVLIAALAAAHHYFDLSWGWAAVIFAVWLVKDAVIYPFLKEHYALRDEDATRTLVGQRAVAQEPLRPRGYVKLRGELWLAELKESRSTVAAGEVVTVEGVEGLTLVVKRLD